MKKRILKRWLSILMTIIMIAGMMPLSTTMARDVNNSENTVDVSRGETKVATRSSYPNLYNLVEGTTILHGYSYKFYKNGTVNKTAHSIDPDNDNNNSALLNTLKAETSLSRYVAYSNGVLKYWTRSEDDFLDLSDLTGKSVTLTLFDNLTFSAIYAPGVNLKIRLTNDAYVMFRHSTQYKGKTGYCTGNTGAVIDLAKTAGSLGDCGTFELCGYGTLLINTRNAPKKSSPDYGIVAKNTKIGDNTEVAIYCVNSYRQVVCLISTISLTIDTTREVRLGMYNTFAVASAWGCHMNNCNFLNAKEVIVGVALGKSYWKIFGDNGETDPAQVFKNYRNSGKIGKEWYPSWQNNSSGQYILSLNRKSEQPRISFKLNDKAMEGTTLVEGLRAGLGYPIYADILYMPEWMQKLKDDNRVNFYFFARLVTSNLASDGYDEAYIDDFYVSKTGRRKVEFVWICVPRGQNDDYLFTTETYLKNNVAISQLDNMSMYYTYIYRDVLLEDSVSGTNYIWNVNFQQAGGEFTAETNATHKLSLRSDTFAKCYPVRNYPIPSKWNYNYDKDAYYMYFRLRARKGYEFAPQVAAVSSTTTLNVQNTVVVEKQLSKDYKTLYITLVAKRRLTDVRGTLKNFRYGADSSFTEIVSNAPKKYTFQNPLVYEAGYGSGYGVEAGYFGDAGIYQVYFDVTPGYGYYLPENASVKVIRPAGYDNGTEYDPYTYDTVYKGDWYDYTPIDQKYRTESWIRATSEMKVFGTDIRIQEPKAGDRPVGNSSYAKPTSLPQNMKVLSMQWRKIVNNDSTPMGTNDKFEIGKRYILDLRIGFEGGAEKGHVYPKNWGDFKVNGKSVNAWMKDADFTNGHVLQVYESYKVFDPNAIGTLSGTAKSFGSATDKVTMRLIKNGASTADYTINIYGNSATYKVSSVEFGSYTMEVWKKNHVSRKYKITVSTGTLTKSVTIHLKGDINGDGKVNTSDVGRVNAHAKGFSLLSDYPFACADTNGDGKVNTSDVGKLNAHAKGKSFLW